MRSRRGAATPDVIEPRIAIERRQDAHQSA
jgi:hypothetical protein